MTGDGGQIRNTAILKDTVIVPACGYVVIAFQADNPGYWFLHCHIEVHQLEGMGVMIEEYPSDQHPKPPTEINNQGHFRWRTEDYNKFVKNGEACKGDVTEGIDMTAKHRHHSGNNLHRHFLVYMLLYNKKEILQVKVQEA